MPNWSQGFQGAAGGAMAGSAFGPAGTIVGGVLGGLGGMFGGSDDPNEKYRKQLEQLAQGYGSRTAPQLGQANQSGYSGFRSNQAGLIAQLEAMARGQGPSAAAIQMREAMDRAAGAQASAAAGAGGRGVNSGAAMRNAMNNTAAIQAQGARDTMTMRSQEQMGAMGQLGQVTAQGRAADENTNQFNAGAQNQFAMANLQAQMQQLGLNDESQLRALMAAMGAPQQPGMGTQILAGGAQALPSILQYRQGQQQNAMQQQYMAYLQSQGNPMQGSLQQYYRPEDGFQGPITSPSQLG